LGANMNSICNCQCHIKYGDKSICQKCIERHKASPYYNIMKKYK
jgi:hypothetical protein